MAEPLILWSETAHFLELLGRSQEEVLEIHGLLYPPRDKRKEPAFGFFPLTPAGKDLAEKKLLSDCKGFSYGIRINPGGTKAAQITAGVALFMEADGGLSLEEQEAIPIRLGLPEPTFSVWTGGKSLHHYWVAKEGEALPVAKWREGQERLIAAVQAAIPEAGVDLQIKDPSRTMRAPGGLHPTTGERCRIHSEGGERFDLQSLVEMLPELPAKKKPKAPAPTAATGDDIQKAKEALGALPPEDFTEYGPWLQVGMALHSVSEELLPDWLQWCSEMGEDFDEEECCSKWESFSSSRDSSIGLGSLIHWAKPYGLKVRGDTKGACGHTADTSSRYTAGVSGVSGVSGVGTKSVRAMSTQERMVLLRRKVEELVTDETTASLDRLPVLREIASELDLSVRDGELQKLIWEARRRMAGPVEAIGQGDVLDFTPVPWCWEGLLMREAANLVVALPKAGKTSLLLGAIAAWSRGEPFLDRPFHGDCPSVLIVGSDQPQSDWGRMLQKVGLVDEARRLMAPIVGLFHSGTPLSLDHEGIEKIASYARKHPGLLVLIDSYARCVGKLGLKERDEEIAEPLADLQEALSPYGATIVVIHHSNKGSRNEGAAMASRGSTALPAACSQILHLQRMEDPEGGQQQRLSGKRILRTEGRGGAPEELLLEMEEGLWSCKGSAEELFLEQERIKTVSSLTERQSIALEHVEEVWAQTSKGVSADLLASLMDLQGADTARVARRLLEQLRSKGLVKKRVENLGMGTGGIGSRYVPATADTSTSTADTADTADTAAVKRTGVSGVEEAPLLEPFDSVEAFVDGQWGNGWMVSAVDGDFVDLIGVAGQSLRMRKGLVQLCQAA
jgi:hypothetical protein